MANGTLPLIHSADELEALVLDVGFLPLVGCGVEGFSVHACTPPDRWFVRDVEGPWEWRETIADRGKIAYAKVFSGKTGFVSPEYYPDFVNWRRGGMDFADRYEAGLISRLEKQIMDLMEANGPMLSRELRAAVGMKGFESAMTRLQMRTDVVIQRLEYRRDAFGRPYGMGTSRFAPSEAVFGEEFLQSRYDEEPEASRERIAQRIRAFFPNADEKAIASVLRW